MSETIRPRRKSTRIAIEARRDEELFRQWQAHRQQKERVQQAISDMEDALVQQTIAILETCDRATRLKIFDWLTDNIEKE